MVMMTMVLTFVIAKREGTWLFRPGTLLCGSSVEFLTHRGSLSWLLMAIVLPVPPLLMAIVLFVLPLLLVYTPVHLPFRGVGGGSGSSDSNEFGKVKVHWLLLSVIVSHALPILGLVGHVCRQV